jgi:hypothetical protein
MKVVKFSQDIKTNKKSLDQSHIPVSLFIKKPLLKSN